MNTPVVTVDNVIKEYKTGGGSFFALKGVSMEIHRGEFVIIKGRSGSGKTTLMNVISTLDKPTDGHVYFEGQDVTAMSPADAENFRRTKVGFCFQSTALIPVMSAYENIDFALRIAGGHETRDARIREAARLVGMEERLLHMPQQMSGGEQQRIAIARAVVHRPALVFADEPTGALDTAAGLAVVRLFRRLTEEEGITLIMTTHDPGLMQMGDRVFEMEDGNLTEVTGQ